MKKDKPSNNLLIRKFNPHLRANHSNIISSDESINPLHDSVLKLNRLFI